MNSEHDLSVVILFWKPTALPLWMVMKIRWTRYCVSNVFDVTIVNLLPISCISSVACAFNGPPSLFPRGKTSVFLSTTHISLICSRMLCLLMCLLSEKCLVDVIIIIIIIILFIYFFNFFFSRPRAQSLQAKN